MGEYSYNNPTNKMRARRLLKSYYDEAMEKAQQRNAKPDASDSMEASPLFQAVARHLTLENLDGLHIYPGPAGGWHADVTLRGMPAGVNEVLGTPKMMPCRTREEAVTAGKEILTMLIQIATSDLVKRDSTLPEDVAPFLLDEVTIYLPLELLDKVKKTAGTPDDDYVRQRLTEVRQEIGGGHPITKAMVEALPREKFIALQALSAMALLAGVPRWPEIPDSGPVPSTLN